MSFYFRSGPIKLFLETFILGNTLGMGQERGAVGW